MSLFTGSQNGKLSFKNLVRSIIRASRWKISLVGPKEGSSSGDLANKSWYEDKDTLHFNVNAFKSGYSGTAGMSRRAKFVLMKNARERTDKELEYIYTVVDQMKCFKKYSPMVRRELTRVIHFETFEDGRVMLREGHQGFSMYFIVAGSVIAKVTQEDSRTNEKRTLTIGEISAGSSFGELALVQECTRTVTIVCKGTSQFLRVDKPDFDMVLRRSYEKEWEDRLQILKSIPVLKQWTDGDLTNINLNCRVEEFASDSVIIGNSYAFSDHVYFILYGVCKLIRQIEVLETKDGCGKTIVQLPSRIPPNNSNQNRKLHKRFLQIGILESGDYFGVGEDMTGCFILAFGKVRCLMIPRHVILSLERLDTSGKEILKVGAVKELLKNTSERMISEKETFDKWMINLGWKNYTKKITTEILEAKGMRYHQQTSSGNKQKSPFSSKKRK